LLVFFFMCLVFFFFSSRRRHTRFSRDWSSDVCSSDLVTPVKFNSCSLFCSFSINGFFGSTNVAFDLSSLLISLSAGDCLSIKSRSEERRVGKECRSRRSLDH